MHTLSLAQPVVHYIPVYSRQRLFLSRAPVSIEDGTPDVSPFEPNHVRTSNEVYTSRVTYDHRSADSLEIRVKFSSWPTQSVRSKRMW